MKMSKLAVPLLVSLFSLTALALDSSAVFAWDLKVLTQTQGVQTRILSVPGGAGGNIRVEISLPRQGQPTFFFLPGSNRAVRQQDLFMQNLTQQGVGWVALSFSRHPSSLAQTSNHRQVVSRDYSLQNLRQEVQLVKDFITTELRLSNVIPVTFSYSGILSPMFSSERFVFEMVPMTSMNAAAPGLASLRSSLETAEFFNPIFGPVITRRTLDATYRSVWNSSVLDLVRAGELRSELIDSATEGYVSLVRAAESVDLVRQDRMRTSNVRRAFLLAEGEGRELLEHQIERFNQIQLVEPASILVLVEKVGHLMMNEQPRFLAELMPFVLQKLQEGRGGVIVIDPTTGEMKNQLP
jgi:hypothetical protein